MNSVYTKAMDQGESQFYQYSKENPKFTGDIIFHIRLGHVLQSCHIAKVDQIDTYIFFEAVDSLFCEIQFWLDKKISEEIELELDNISEDLTMMIQNGKDEFILYQKRSVLRKLLRKLNYEAHKTGLILATNQNNNQDLLGGD
jgi:hypothetical protein